jgi:ketosteroid isomerase-like protein
MSKNLAENFLNSFADEPNKGNLSYLVSLYETNACFVSQSGEIVKGQENIRQSLQNFIDMKGKLETTVKNVFSAQDIALVISEWSFSGTGPDGKVVSLGGKATDVLRQQSDGTWRIVIDNPWGTDISTQLN